MGCLATLITKSNLNSNLDAIMHLIYCVWGRANKLKITQQKDLKRDRRDNNYYPIFTTLKEVHKFIVESIMMVSKESHHIKQLIERRNLGWRRTYSCHLMMPLGSQSPLAKVRKMFEVERNAGSKKRNPNFYWTLPIQGIKGHR